MRRVVVTGLGAVTPLGLGVKRTWKRLIDGDCGVVYFQGTGKWSHKQRSHVAALVPKGQQKDGGFLDSEHFTDTDSRHLSRYMKYAAAASEEGLKDAAWHPETEEQQYSTGVSLGSGMGSFMDNHDTALAYEKHGPNAVLPYFMPKQISNSTTGFISEKFNLKGSSIPVGSACTTSAQSIMGATINIQIGEADVMVAGGAESCILPLAFASFERIRCLTTSHNDTPSEASCPFDAARDGFVIGEGAATLVLEELEHARARGASIYAEVAGYGNTADAYHVIQPPSDGNGIFRAMRNALRKAGLPPSAVDYINAHATSTKLGDLAENRAIKKLMLGESGKSMAEQVNVSSTKGAIGHLLGAAGAVEGLFSVLAIKHGILPPTLNLTNPDGVEFDCNYVALEAQEKKVDVVLSNSSAFGGTNISLCFRRYEES